ncbi:unnamed protein product [Ascophyllum nodosum]
MTAIGFAHSKVDPCVFRKVVNVEEEMVVVVHLDDILAHVKDQATMEGLAAEFWKEFEVEGHGRRQVLRIGDHTTRGPKACEFTLDQHLYIKSTEDTFDFEKASEKAAFSAVPTLSKVGEPQTPEDKKEMSKFPYREGVGALMYTATMTRPDIACAVRAVARFCEKLGLVYKNTVLEAMRNTCFTRRNGGSRTVGRAVDLT